MKKIEVGYNENVEYEKTVNKVRVVLLNKEGKALFVKYAGMYMFPGGKIDDGESELEALKREISEEAGIYLDTNKVEEFLEFESYDENYLDRPTNTFINRITNTKFYFAETDQEIDKSKAKLSESEKKVDFEIHFVNLSFIPYLVETNETDDPKNINFKRETLTALREFTKYRENQKINIDNER